MSALPSKADIAGRDKYVRFVPKQTYAVEQFGQLLDHLDRRSRWPQFPNKCDVRIPV